MVKGLEIFKERMEEHQDAFVLIGGAACDEWFSGQGLTFRATRDLDVVVVLEAVTPDAVASLRSFIEEGGYEVREVTEGDPPILYRFSKPSNAEFPAMIELFSRGADGLDLGEDQAIVPIPAGSEVHSLSAILLDQTYYDYLIAHTDRGSGFPIATATALIPLKAHAWIDLSRRKEGGEQVDSREIKKHRNDVFRLAVTLPGEAGPEIPEIIKEDLVKFLDEFPDSSDQWSSILASIKGSVGGNVPPATFIGAIRTYFAL